MIGMMLIACTNMMHMVVEEDCRKNAVANVVVDGVYFDPENDVPKDPGLYLDVGDQDYIVLPLVNSDSEGFYLPARLSIENHKTCRFCGAKYILRCRNEECPAFKKRKEGKSHSYEHCGSKI